MTSRIYINIEADSAAEARVEMAKLLGPTGPGVPLDFKDSVREPLVLDEAGFLGEKPVDPDAMTAVGEKIAETQASAPVAARERGKPSPGHARRTKAEIAEDEAADKSDAEVNAQKAEQDRQNDVVAQHVEDSPETQAADAADEAAETEAARDPAKPLTLDSVRNALGEYVKAYGMAAAQADGPVLIAKVLGVEVDPEAPKKISDLGDDQALLKRAVDGVGEMITKNPFKREPAQAVTA